jgi:hypothetical protein
VPEIWIALDARDRRKNWWWTGVLTLVFTAMALAALLPEKSNPHPSAAEHWWWIGTIGTFWLAALFYMINRGYGRTLLASDRMQFHTFISRRSIAWSEVTEIEKHHHRSPRNGGWWEARVHRSDGRPLVIPGAFTGTWNDDGALDQKIVTIHEYWAEIRRKSS